MQMKRNSLILGAIFVMGMFACKKESPKKDPIESGTTYMSVSITLPQELRAEKEDDKHNLVGEWEGRDEIKNVDIYLVANGKVEPKTLNATSQGGTIYETSPFSTTGGTKKIYVVVNNNGDVKAALDNAATIGADAFDKAYREAYDVITKGDDGAVKGEYAKVEGGKDIIIMTGTPVEKMIQDGVTKEQAAAMNKVSVAVRRLASRVLVTKDKDLESKVEIIATSGAVKKVLGELQNLKWTVAQYDKKSYLHSFGDKISAIDVKSPAFDFIPSSRDDYESQARDKYDYSLLVDRSEIVVKGPSLTEESMLSSMKYITETTHKYAKLPEVSGYVRGNTTYVMVEGKFVPNKEVFAAGEFGKANVDGTIYLGTKTGLFYRDKDVAIAANDGGAQIGGKDGVIEFKEGKMFYFAWLNPDELTATTWNSSPVIRNNIYNVNVKSFSKYGFSGNPYNPGVDNEDPDPDDPTPDPKDPIYDKETYMTTEITVIKWGTHSYNINF